MKKTKLPADLSQRAKMIVDIATGEKEVPPSSYMAKIGRKGGQKGGPARAAALSAEERSKIAKKAAAARWGKKD